MRKLDVSAVSTTVGMPVKAGTLNHIQLAYQEALTALANNFLGSRADTANTFILYGCVKSGSGPFDISTGAVYYNGEVYLVDAVTGIALSGGQVIVGNIVTTQYTSGADAVLFTDGISRNIHNIRKMVFTAGTAGSGTVDFDSMKMCGFGLKSVLGSTFGSSYTVKFDQDKTEEFTTATVNTTITFDFTNAVPGCVVRLKWTWGSGLTLTVTAGSGQAVLLDSGDLTKCAGNTNTTYFLYVGKNAAGNDEVSYSVNQTA
jgi:hypothetical protein